MLLGFLTLLGVQSAWGITVKGGTFYFDNVLTQWSKTHTYLCVGKDVYNSDYTSTYDMTAIGNTTLYYKDMSQWDGATFVAVIGNNSSFDSGNWGSSNVSNAEVYTACLKSDYEFNGYNYYVISPASSVSGAAISVNHLGSEFSNLNGRTQTIGIKVDATNSGTFTEITGTNNVVTLSGNGYTFSAYNTCNTAANNNITKDDTYAKVEVGGGYRAHVTLSFSELAAGYHFVGWYKEDGTELSTEETYEYYPDAAQTVYAHFNRAFHTIGTTPDYYATFSAPYNVQVPSDVTVYKGVRVGEYISLKAYDNHVIPANEPVVLKSTSTSGSSFSAVATDDTAGSVGDGDNALTATLNETVATDLSSSTYYVLGLTGENTAAFLRFTGNSIPANKAYILVNSAYASAPMIRFEENNATNINAFEANETAVKFIENGKLFIRKNGVVYDATGTIVK